MLILMSKWAVLKDLKKKNLPATKYLNSSTKNGKTRDDGKKSESHISLKDYLTCDKNLG